jgi:hypothetical protein
MCVLTKAFEIVRSSTAQVTTGHWLCSADKMLFLQNGRYKMLQYRL